MICPQCSEKIRNREAYRATKPACPKCRYQFVLFPNEESKLNDNFFVKKLKAISPDNAYFFTTRQLYYFILNAKAVQENLAGCLTFLIVLAGIVFVFFIPPLGIFLIIAGILAVIFTLFVYKNWKLPYDINKFKEIVIKPWELFKGKIEKLLPENDLSFNKSEFKDIMDYSFDALIITGDNEIANFLIKNDFHFKNKTAIVSYQKYPNHLFPYVIDQVKKNSKIPVFLVHNADIIFAGMKEKVEKKWFEGQKVNIFDLGLHPRQVQKSKRFITYKRNNVSPETPLALKDYSKKEVKWFKDGNYAELSFLPPVKLLAVLEYSINIYKEKGPEELLKVSNAIFLMGLGIGLPKKGSDSGLDIDFGSDFG
jgi:hypothetical protein